MRILLITISARGHAIADALARSPQHPSIIHVCPQRNPGIRRLAEEQVIVSSLMDFPAILDVAKNTRPDFAVIGPEDPIGGGLADALEEMGVPSVAPKKSLARIEASKGFTRGLWEKEGILAAPRFRIFRGKSSKQQAGSIKAFLEEELGGNYVVKYDGLAGGKGVKVSGEHLQSVKEGLAYAEECMAKSGQVVIEEKLEGCEFSLMSFVAGTQVVSMPAVQDHKRAFEGDTGPNTGGMGSYSDTDHSLPFLRKKDIEAAHELNVRTAVALQRACPEHAEGYRGILYGGFIAVRDGVKLIEYNCRFGDPEALNVLPLLRSDFVEICQAILRGDLNTNIVQFERLATVCKYITPKSYPEAKQEKGQEVIFPKDIPEDARIYIGDVTEDADGSLRLGGSRTAGIVGMGKTLAEAEAVAEKLCRQVEGSVRYRKDIGMETLIRRRIEVMKGIRG